MLLLLLLLLSLGCVSLTSATTSAVARQLILPLEVVAICAFVEPSAQSAASI
jgi:hypothetical protein